MTKIKLTKHELKAQRESMRRYERYLPTLRLKKEQLQSEVRDVERRIEAGEESIRRHDDSLSPWIKLFSTHFDFQDYLTLREVQESQENVAGVGIPVLTDVRFSRTQPDLFATDPWVDEALRAIEDSIRLQLELFYLKQQRALLSAELRVTTQRVNLFEQVMIPECTRNIRRIQVFLGDQQTVEMARAKLAKRLAARGEYAP
jgi:V/A-type H+-transporting ATPase subunit D